MARPKDADSARTYARILEAAHELLEERDGPQSLSLRAVATRAGVTASTIQYYFSSKEELLEACLDEYYERLASLALQLVGGAEAATSDTELIEDGVRRLYRFAYQNRGLAALRLVTNVARGELHPRRQAQFFPGFLEQIADGLAPHVHVSALDVRMGMQAMSWVVVRFALLTDAEVTKLTGLELAEGRRAVEDGVVRLARRVVRPGDG